MSWSVQYTSNLFLNTARCSRIVKPVAPNLLLLGNIGQWENHKTQDFLNYARGNWDKIFWVPSPHDLSSPTGKPFYEILDKMYANGKICILEQSEICIPGTDIVLLGCPLHINIYLNKKALMKEYKDVYKLQGQDVMPLDVAEWFWEDRDWLKGRLCWYKRTGYPRRVIVCTHTSPFVNLGGIFNDTIPVYGWLHGGSSVLTLQHKNIYFMSNGSSIPQSLELR